MVTKRPRPICRTVENGRVSLTPENASVVARSLYARLLADQELAHFFEGRDLRAQAARMADALSHAHLFQDPGRRDRLVAAHHGLRSRGLSVEHFDRVIRHLGAAMTEYGLADEISALVEVFAPMRQPMCGD